MRCPQLTICIFLWFASSANCVNTTNSSTIILVHAIFRHGIRAPTVFYPTDPFINHTFYPAGRGGLTNRGKFMMFKLGQILRRRYPKLLGDIYLEEKLYVRSTDTARTKMSAALVLAGLWPPAKTQMWHTKLRWQPIPVETKSAVDEDLLDPSNCPLRQKILETLEANQTLSNQYRQNNEELFKFIEQKSGLTIKTPQDILELYVTLRSESECGLTLPDWTKNVFPHPLQNITAEVYEYENLNPTAEIVQSGYFLSKVVNDTYAKINKLDERKSRVMYLYATHDTSMGGILHALKVLKGQIPEFGSAIIFELHKQAAKYFMKLKFLENPLSPEFVTLDIPNCANLCPLDDFLKLYEPNFPTVEYHAFCNKDH